MCEVPGMYEMTMSVRELKSEASLVYRVSSGILGQSPNSKAIQRRHTLSQKKITKTKTEKKKKRKEKRKRKNKIK